ncbi:hypothetical protein KP509_03G094100 [Ceratopteris richardii]|uniref:Thylakoid membrane protein TERC, chloroplastic n=1 Tax=Ceratopteris richardii TaxID=49495 RepID=A0A8T2VA52_CERRI|nr:hypothetical protein KP509_03G094100 [Ceratopteris richardii]
MRPLQGIMAAADSCVSSPLGFGVAVQSSRRGKHFVTAHRRYCFSRNRDWILSDSACAQRPTHTSLISKDRPNCPNGWFRPAGLHLSSWSISSFSEQRNEAKVSGANGSVTSEEQENSNIDSHAEESHSSLVAETVEAAAQTVSSVGEIEYPSFSEEPAISHSAALRTVIFWVSSAITFGIFILLKEGPGKASEFFTGYLVEQSLSVDNLFVFVIIFKYFQVPVQYQSRILTYGISGAIIFRATMILLGVATIQKFEAVNLFFASILIFTSYKLLTEEDEGGEDLSENFIVNICKRVIPVTDTYDKNKFFTNVGGSMKATPLFLTLAVIELSDIAFAVDSIPAVFGVTRDPFIVFSSNIFAILGLRSLYTLISSSMEELDYIQPSVALVLGFIGSKMIADYFGFHISREMSLGVVVSVLGIGVGLSLWKKRNAKE